jgi:hypothetical protein
MGSSSALQECQLVTGRKPSGAVEQLPVTDPEHFDFVADIVLT